jgi:hypothetical protein
MSFAELVAAMDRAVIAAFGDKDGDGEPVSVTYTPEVGPSVEVTGLFDAPYALAKGGESPMFNGVETVGPSVFLRLSDLPGDPESDEPTLTIRSVAYRVVERRRDDMGGIVLQLKKA